MKYYRICLIGLVYVVGLIALHLLTRPEILKQNGLYSSRPVNGIYSWNSILPFFHKRAEVVGLMSMFLSKTFRLFIFALLPAVLPTYQSFWSAHCHFQEFHIKTQYISPHEFLQLQMIKRNVHVIRRNHFVTLCDCEIMKLCTCLIVINSLLFFY